MVCDYWFGKCIRLLIHYEGRSERDCTHKGRSTVHVQNLTINSTICHNLVQRDLSYMEILQKTIVPLYWLHYVNGIWWTRTGKYSGCFGKAFVLQNVGEKPYKNSGKYHIIEVFRGLWVYLCIPSRIWHNYCTLYFLHLRKKQKCW